MLTRFPRRFFLGEAVAHEYILAVLFLHILDRTSSFDAADGEAASIVEARDNTSLPFQRALHCFVELGRFAQINNVDVTVGGSDDEECVHNIDAVNSLLTLHRRDGSRLA